MNIHGIFLLVLKTFQPFPQGVVNAKFDHRNVHGKLRKDHGGNFWGSLGTYHVCLCKNFFMNELL